MYDILIVDDEVLICEDLKSKIQRMNKPDIGKIYTAHNGAEALKVVAAIRPHILLTDIRMPVMDGLELLMRLTSEFPDIKVIVLSGYGEYEYVRQAFKYGVTDYLLKPAGMGELQKHISRLIDQIKEEQAVSREESVNRELNLRLHVENCLRQLFHTSLLAQQQEPQPPADMNSFFKFPLFCVSLVSFNTERLYGDSERIIRTLLEQRTGTLEMVKLFVLQDTGSTNAIVCNFAHESGYEHFKQVMRDLMCKLREECHTDASASVSEIGTSINMLRSLYNQAKQALAWRIIGDKLEIHEYRRIAQLTGNQSLPPVEINLFRESIRQLDMNKIKAFIDTWFERSVLEKTSIRYLQWLYDMILSAANHHLSVMQLSQSAAPVRSFESFQSLYDFRTYIFSYLFQINRFVSETTEKTASPVDLVVHYIKQNFHRNISLHDAASRVSMNYTYFSSLFKEQTGFTFSSYVTRLRMEEAKRLLRDPSLRINEISDKVGYDNLYHFSRAFKNYVGMSPKDYRQGAKKK